MPATNRNPELARAFGLVIREVRQRKGIAQEALALLAETDRSYMGRIERGEKQPSLDLVFRISGALGLAPSRLVELVSKKLEKSSE